MACSIHYDSVSTDEKLTSPSDLASWKTLLKAAEVRCHQPLLDIAKSLKEDEVPKVFYHRQCRSVFTLKRDLTKILKTKEESSQCDEPPSKCQSTRGETSDSRVYGHHCIFCGATSKYIKGSRTRETVIHCLQLRGDQSVRDAAIRKCDEKILALTSREILAAEAHYHGSCYKLYTKPPKEMPSAASTSTSDDGLLYKSLELTAYEELLQFIQNEIFLAQKALKLATLTQHLVSTMKNVGVNAVKDSTKKRD